MAVLESTQTSSWTTTGSTVVLTKPVDLAVGDLLICRISTAFSATISSFGVFTSLGDATTGSGEYRTYLGAKIADSSDVAASNFTVTMSGGGVLKMGSLSRISNPDTLFANYKYVEGSATNTISPSFTGLTPTNHADDNLLLQFWTGDNSNSGIPTIDSYAIATDNPSWTEIYEISDSSGTDVTASMASATRSQTTATGNFSASWSDGTTDSCGQMIAITIPWRIDVDETATLTEVYSYPEQSIIVQESVTPTEDVEATKQRMYTNTDKSSTTWINQNK